MNINAYATQAADAPLAPFTIDRREPGPKDIQIQILFSGICHSDVHQARNEWGNSIYPMVPGMKLWEELRLLGRKFQNLK